MRRLSCQTHHIAIGSSCRSSVPNAENRSKATPSKPSKHLKGLVALPGLEPGLSEYGLEALTHLRAAKMDGIHPPPPTAYSRWIRWWMTDGQTATIFRPDQCGEIKPIPFS
jgi:hypothetical protein